MTESLDRDEILALLERLGGDDDAEVLAAARTLHEAVVGAGFEWDELLVGEGSGTAPGSDAVATAGDGGEAPSTAGGDRDAEALALIDKLMARPGITEEFRSELEGYKADIAEGEFADADQEYLRALDKRLSDTG